MDLNSIIALAQAGFTKDQIMQLATTQQPQQPIQQPMQQPVIQQPVVQQPVVQQPMQQPVMQQPVVQQPVMQQTPQPDPFQQLFEQMTGIKQAIQQNNIASSQITGGAPQTTDDILASIIQPTKPKEE